MLNFLTEQDDDLKWQSLTEDTFTDEHNWEIVNAFLDGDETLKPKLSLRGKPLTVDDTVFTLYTR